MNGSDTGWLGTLLSGSQWGQLITMAAPLLGLGTCLGGCRHAMSDNGEHGFEYSTSFGFYTRTSETKATATNTLEAPAILDWIIGDDETEEPVPDPEG